MKKLALAATATLLAVTVSGCSIFYPNWGEKTPPIGTPSASDQPTSIESPSASSSASASETPSQAPVQPAKINVLQQSVDSSGISVIAEAQNFSEDGGSCTLTFTNGTVKKSVTVKAESNASDTQCFPMTLPLTGLPKGAGLITITYSSKTHLGTSTAIAVTIP
jgi:hypothetical protein